MSDTFTASNGVEIEIAPGGHLLMPPAAIGLGEESQQALREFFLHERDKELWRWRSGDEPNWVVYHAPNVNGDHYVVNELTGYTALWGRDTARDSIHSGESKAIAVEYFAAHPEPRPWHDARDGQLWLIRFDDFPDTDVSALVKGGMFVYNDHCHEGTATLEDSSIVGGTQIWPEVKP